MSARLDRASPIDAPIAGDAPPISRDEGLALFREALQGGNGPPIIGPILLAVSGGPDSMAMLWLALCNRIELDRAGINLHVATVDHGLREASRMEAEMVADVCGTFALPHRILCWTGAKPGSNRQGAARQARYRLLEEAANSLGAAAILTAHHQDDQFETHVLAMERRSGDRGLAGMRARRALAPALDLIRPFLGMPARRMRQTAVVSGLPFFDDPSNRDERYDRVRIRHALADMGEDARAGRQARIAQHRDAARQADAIVAKALEAACAEVDAFGRVFLHREPLFACPGDIRATILGRIVTAVAGAEHAPEWAALIRLDQLLGRVGARAATLGGVRVEPGERLVFAREFGRAGPQPVSFDDSAPSVLFDRRFTVSRELGDAPNSGREEGAWLEPLGVLERGNAAERTMPILIGRDGVPLAVPDVVARKVPEVSGRLRLVSRVAWRLRADLPRDEMA